MMIRFFWKELHERWIWLTLWLLAVVAAAWLDKGQGFNGEPFVYNTSWTMVPMGVALLAGLGAYGSELTGERATFLYSRPISWKQLLLVKVLLGLAVALLATTLGALAMRFTIPVEYLPFATPGKLALSSVEFAGITSIAYLVGLGCSIALPGLAGSILTLLIGFGGLSLLESAFIHKY